MQRVLLAIGSSLVLFGVFLRTTPVQPGVSPMHPTATKLSAVGIGQYNSTAVVEAGNPGTATETPARETVLPFKEPDRYLLWEDSFDIVSPGWVQSVDVDPASSTDNSSRQITSGAYHFWVDPSRLDMQWDIHRQLTLPDYPYVVDVDVRALRQQYAVLLLDYHGDPMDLNSGSGLYATVGMSAPPQETLFSSPVWSDYGSPPKGAKVNIFENTGGLSWELPCTPAIGLPINRAIRISAYVSALMVVLSIEDTTNATKSWVSCQRIQNRQVLDRGKLGVGAVYRSNAVPAPVTDALLVDRIAVSGIAAMPEVQRATDTPREIDTTSCYEETKTSWVTAEIASVVGGNYDICVGGDVPPDSQLVLRYPEQINNFIGTWQCGIDPENQMNLRWDGTHIIAVFAAGQSYEMVTVWRTDHPSITHGFELIPYPSQSLAQALRPGDFYREPTPFRLYLQDDVFVTNWAGFCTRQP